MKKTHFQCVLITIFNETVSAGFHLSILSKIELWLFRHFVTICWIYFLGSIWLKPTFPNEFVEGGVVFHTGRDTTYYICRWIQIWFKFLLINKITILRVRMNAFYKLKMFGPFTINICISGAVVVCHTILSLHSGGGGPVFRTEELLFNG